MNIFSKFFKSDNKTNEKNNTNSEGNCIIFSLNPLSNNEPFIKIKIESTSTEDSIKFAELLRDVTDGLYNDSITNLMLKMTDQDLDIKKFVHSTILHWIFLLKNQSCDNTELLTKIQNQSRENQPIIMPTDFNKNAK